MLVQNSQSLISKDCSAWRRITLELVETALKAADPYENVKSMLRVEDGKLFIGEKHFAVGETGENDLPLEFDLSKIGKVYVLGGGKAVQRIAKAIEDSMNTPDMAARRYTELIDQSNVSREMRSARNFRQTIARLGPLCGMPLSILGGLLPKFRVEEDYKAMTPARYRLKPDQHFDKDTFTAMAATEHREEEPSHLTIRNPELCRTKCLPMLNGPCMTFCPAGVYETIQGEVKPANPWNCLHCKTCQRKCPLDNIRWTVPEGAGGPRYKRM